MKNLKKIFLFVFTVTTFLLCFVFSINALDATGKCGDNVYWKYEASTKELEISGEGAMWDYFSGHSSPFCNSDIEKISINNGVTVIGKEVFKECFNLIAIDLPDSLLTIKSYAFFRCYGIENITIPKGVTKIENYAFDSCESLVELFVNADNLAYSSDKYGVLFDKAKNTLIKFPSNNALESYSIPESVVKIDNSAFEGCRNLKKVTMNSGVTTIGDNAFSHSYLLNDITISNNVSSIGSSAFAGTNITSITLPNNITTINGFTFWNCDSLTNITLGENVVVINNSAFWLCSNLTKVTILNPNCEIYDSSRTISSSATIYGRKNSTAQSYAEKYERSFVIYCLHENKEQINATNPSCTEIGFTAGEYCPDCEIWLSGHEVIPATNHKNTTAYPQQNATCTEIGYTAGVYCLDCKLWLSGHDAIPATNHKNKVAYPQQNATCTESGYTAGKYCPDCKSWIEGHEVIPALNHKNKISHIQQNPTCTETGYTAGTYCPDCKVWLEGHEVIPALNHKNKTSHIQQNPTCIETGYTAGTYCPDCKVWLEGHEVIPVLGHTEVVDKAVLATEKENGLTEGSHCSVCGVVLVKQEIIPAVLQYNGSYYTVDPVASDNLNNAITLESGQTYYKEYTSKYHSRYWYAKFTIKENSYASIGFTAKYYYEFSIRDENGFVVKDFGSKQKYDGYFPLEAGTYYVVLNNKSYSNNSVVLSYSLFENVFCEREPNDTFTTATTIGFDQKYLVFSNASYNNDYLSFNTKKGQKITVYVYGFEESNPSVSLYESDRNTYYSISMNLKFDEKKKVYYYDFTSKYDGIYFIKINFAKSEVSCSLKLGKSDCSNHSYKTTTTKATLTKNGKVENKCSVCGYVSKTTTIYYSKTIKLSTTSYTYNGKAKTPTVTVKDSKGNALKKDTDYTVKYASGRKNTGKYTVTITFTGKYSGTKTLYFNILPSKTSKITPTCSTTEIKASWSKVTGASGYKVELLNSKGKVVKSVTTTKTSYTFKKLSKVTTYKIRVTAYKTIDKKAAYSTVSTTITTSTSPAKVTLSKVTAGSKQAAVAWNTVSGASGYEVQYSTSSKFKSAKTSTVSKGSSKKTTIKKLTKGKKYYFKVRAYKTVDGKKIYGAWSSVKSVKVK